MHCLAAWAQWAVELLLCTTTLPRGVGSRTPAMHCLTAWEQWTVGDATPAMQCLIARWEWVVQLL